MRLKPHNALLVALLSGALLGALAHAFLDTAAIQAFSQYVLRPIGQIFLRSIFMIVVPMVFSALVIGVYELGTRARSWPRGRPNAPLDGAAEHRSVIVGVVLVNLDPAGHAVTLGRTAPAASVQTLQANAAAAKPLSDILVELIPRNPLESAVRALDGEMLPLMVFSLIFGVALTRVPSGGRPPPARPRARSDLRRLHAHRALRHAVRTARRLRHRLQHGRSRFGTGHSGLAALLCGDRGRRTAGSAVRRLRRCAGRAGAPLAADVLPPVPRGLSLRVLDRLVQRDAAAVARVAEKKLQLPPHIARFVLTVGSTANQNGTALFEGVTVLFLAQVYGLDLTIGQQVRVMLMSIVAGIGTAGVPGGSLPMVMIVAQSVGVPAEGMALILGVDRFLDMCRTAVNVSGDLVIAALVGRSAGSTVAEAAAVR